MNKVKIPFFDIKEKKTYKEGDEYKGKRKDLAHLFYKEVKAKQTDKKTKK